MLEMLVARRRTMLALVALLVVMGVAERRFSRLVAQQPPAAPRYEVDPFWPKVPKGLILGQVSGITVDARDHVWLIQRPWSLESDEKALNPEAECCRDAPPVMEFDADTGAFKRMWGAYGNVPDDNAPNGPVYEGPGPQQFNLVHGVRVSDDGLVYVAERRNNRVQVFSIDGTFQRELFVERKTKLLGTAFSIAFSPDPEQQLMYVAEAGNGKVHIYDRRSLQEVGAFGRIGHYAGQFVFLHNVATDSSGNLYTAEVGTGRRAQKFVRMGGR